jgi:integrase
MRLQFKMRLPVSEIDDKGQIVLWYTHGSVEPAYRIGTGVRVKPKEWNEEEQRIGIYGDERQKKIEKIYDDIDAFVTDWWYNNGRQNNYPLPSQVRKVYESNKLSPNSGKPLFSVEFARFCLNKIVKPGSRKLYITIQNDIEKVLPTYIVDQVDQGALRKLRDHWTDTLKIANPTSRKRFALIKAFLYKNRKRIQTDWDEFELGLDGYESDVNIHCIDYEEFLALRDYNYCDGRFSDNNIYSIFLWLFSCVTALRISDARRVKSKDIITKKDNSKWLEIEIEKTGGNLHSIPLNETAQIIVQKLNFENDLSEQNIRDNLKTVFEKVAPDMPEQFRSTAQHYKVSGAVNMHEKTHKFRLLVYHSSRKSFPAICIREIGLNGVMAVGYWKTLSAVNRYISKELPKDIDKFLKL